MRVISPFTMHGVAARTVLRAGTRFNWSLDADGMLLGLRHCPLSLLTAITFSR